MMKPILVFAYVFAVFAFLTIGSLMMIVSLHVLSMEDALLKLEALYENSWRSAQMGMAGVLFVFMGLIFSKILIQLTRPAEDVVFYGKRGHANVSLRAIEDLARKTIRKFNLVRQADFKTEISGNHLKIEVNLSVFADSDLPKFADMVRADLSRRIGKVLGGNLEFDLSVHIISILDQPVMEGARSGAES